MAAFGLHVSKKQPSVVLCQRHSSRGTLKAQPLEKSYLEGSQAPEGAQPTEQRGYILRLAGKGWEAVLLLQQIWEGCRRGW